MEPAVLFFYEENNKKCEEVLTILENLNARIVPADVYDDMNLPLIDSWNVCCVPTLVFWPIYEELHDPISEEDIREMLRKNK